jgi:hypothetical protein
MSSTDHARDEETIRYPDELSDRQLFSMSLRSLSKGISLTTSSRITFDVYIRWLEVHRQRPSNTTKQWENTLWQWACSLRARGFKEGELTREIRAWKDHVAPLRLVDGRHPPESRDVEKAFFDQANMQIQSKRTDGLVWKRAELREDIILSYDDESPPKRVKGERREETVYEKYRSSSSNKKALENYVGPPPPSYTCNRCDKKGMNVNLVGCFTYLAGL